MNYLKESLSTIGSRSKEEIEENWYGFSFPYYGFFQWLEGKKLPDEFNSKRFVLFLYVVKSI